jgi:nucleolar protein 6
MSTSQKLTKKQKKGLAFRERKTGKRHGTKRNELDDMEANAVPAMEDAGLAGDDGGQAEAAGDDRPAKGKAGGDKEGGEGQRQEGKVGRKGKGKAAPEDVPIAVEAVKKAAGQKRKREAEEEGAAEGGETAAEKGTTKKSTKRKKTDGESKSQPEGKDKPAKQRFILFLGMCALICCGFCAHTIFEGNLKYTTPLSAIQAHFAACGRSISFLDSIAF